MRSEGGERGIEQDPRDALLAFVNGKILTMDTGFSIAEAVAVRAGRIAAVGSTAEIAALCGVSDRVIDLGGRVMLPGLNDSHAHVEDAGLIDYTVSFDGVVDITDAVQRIRAVAERTPRGDWVRGRIWHPLTQLSEKRFPTRWELDEATADHPVVLPIGHFTLLNSAGLERAGIDRDTPDPEGGEILRDATGEPNGVLAEAAEKLAKDVVPWWSDDVRRAQLIAAQRHFNGIGITSAVSGAVRPSDAALLREIAVSGEASLRLSMMLSPSGELNPSWPLDQWQAYFDEKGPPTDGGDPWISHAAVKMQVDGGMTLRTAAMRAPYAGTTDYFGERVVSQERLDALVAIAHRAGWRVGVHAVGDAGIDMVLDAFAKADRERSIRDRRFIVVHASLMQPDQMRRARDLGVRADIQSVFLWSKAEMVRKHLGDAVADRAIPTRQLIDLLGLDNIASGSDYPINPLNPFINIYLLVTRRDVHGVLQGPDQAISRQEALRLYTSAAARFTFEEGRKGTIEIGKYADLVVLSADILAVPDEAIKDIVADLTIVDGRIVFDRIGQWEAFEA